MSDPVASVYRYRTGEIVATFFEEDDPSLVERALESPLHVVEIHASDREDVRERTAPERGGGA